MGQGSGSLRSSWFVLAALFVASAASPLGCEEPGPGTSEGTADLAMLASVGPSVVVPALNRVATALVDLDAAVAGWHRAEGAQGPRADARGAFLQAMDVWQELEVMQVGPAGSSLSTLGGQDLRDELYSWPTVNPCRVDQQTVEGRFGEPGFFDDSLVHIYGLDALEHLLYAPAANACPNQVDINALGTWDAAGPDAIAGLRAAYAVAIVDHARGVVQELQHRWSPDGGDFGALLSSPGAGSSPYGSAQEATNAVFDALFYLEATTKDRKLAEPLGLGACTAECAKLVEGVPSGSSTLWVAANLRGFRQLFTGGDAAGFDDLLSELGHGDLADRVLDHTDAALSLAEGLDDPIDAIADRDPAEAEALYDAVKKVTDDLKGDLATIMSLRIPAEAAGDND